jgi:DNA-binding transcriptional LysR family regulator
MVAIRLHQLEGFFQVARHGNYTKAAQAFPYPLGQPAVYQQLRGLQEDLGILLVRQAGPRRTELTPEGRALYQFLTPFFEGLPKLLERITAAAAEPLVVTADQFLAMETLPQALLRAQALAPGFQVRLHERAATDLLEAVESGLADVGLTHLLSLPPQLRWEPLGTISAALLVPKAHPLARYRTPPPSEEIAKYPLIVYEPHSPGRLLTERLFRESGRRLQIAAEVTFSQTMRALVRAGLAPAFVPYVILDAPGRPRRPELPREPGSRSYDMTAKLKGTGLPFGLLYRAGMEESVSLRVLRMALRREGRDARPTAV